MKHTKTVHEVMLAAASEDVSSSAENTISRALCMLPIQKQGQIVQNTNLFC